MDSLAWEDVAQSEADLYFNATPIGSGEGDSSALPAEVLANRPLVFDSVYRRDGSPTPTISAARAASCDRGGGTRMFAAQAVRQARLFGVEDATLEEVAAILGRSPRREP